jgi:ubiquinone/menaquinone biosynthesis C-methylase UbiE
LAVKTYEELSDGYASTRRADPRIAAKIRTALGEATSVVNIGAGAGSYEPDDLKVTAVEPSESMIAQRPPDAAPVVQASAERLPFDDQCFDAAMAVLSAHHWSDLQAGLDEMRRVARRRIVIVAFDPDALGGLWIARDYFPQMLQLRRASAASAKDLIGEMPAARSAPISVPRDCTDLFLAALWARPELLFDDAVMEPLWVWQSIGESARSEGRKRLRDDLRSGAWEERYGDLRRRQSLQVGLQLVVEELV